MTPTGRTPRERAGGTFFFERSLHPRGRDGDDRQHEHGTDDDLAYLSGRIKVSDNSDELINAINKFADRLVGRDIKLFFAFPAYSQTEYDKNRVAVDSWVSAFNRQLKVTILGNAKDFISQ